MPIPPLSLKGTVWEGWVSKHLNEKEREREREGQKGKEETRRKRKRE